MHTAIEYVVIVILFVECWGWHDVLKSESGDRGYVYTESK